MSIIPQQAVLKEIIAARVFPMTLAWSRLEGRPRTNNFDRALKAEVRDALWMLCKQWQMGEFRGEDAGSPVTAKLCTSTAELTKYKPDAQVVQAFDRNVPFEAKVEQRAFPFATIEQEISLDLRLIMGRRWMQMLKKNGQFAITKQFFLDNYGFKKPDPSRSSDAVICAHPEAWQQYAAVANRMMDGAKFFFDLAAPTHYFDRAGFPAAADRGILSTMESEFKKWYAELFYQPLDKANDAWISSKLEYQFDIAAAAETGEKTLHAEAYYQGHLDWYNLDVERTENGLGDLPDNPPPPTPDKKVITVIPAPVMFEGMPNTRWWAFEDGRTNFSYIKPDPTDLAKLLLIEFGLIYANDWYLLPYKLPVGSLTKIKGLALTNSFGENFWIEPAGKGDDADWTRWNMFSMKIDSKDPLPADTDLLLLPTVAKIQEGKPMEEVLLIRDEMANMVWGVETIVPLPGSWSRSGFEAAGELHAQWQKIVTDTFGQPVVELPVKDGNEEAKIRYEIMNTIPENWIPFLPVHVPGSNREIQLQRAALPRILDGNPNNPDKIRPRTTLLQEGRAENKPYFV
ncbi:MAG: hypothetical protein ABI151_13750, partial [Chitinophagaceae bacterium]